MSFRRLAVCRILVLAGLLACGDVFAATYHVDQRVPAADDQNDGSVSHPWKTIARAATDALPGDTIVIGTGVYREMVTVTRNGSADKPIHFEAAPAATVIVTGADRITQWTKENAGTNLFSTPWNHDFIRWNATHTHPSDNAHLLIGRCEQVIIGGQPLRQVLDREHLTRGAFFVDLSGRRLYAWSADDRNLADENLICECAARSVVWDCKGEYVQTVGLRFRYAANPAQQGAAVFSGNHDTVEDCIFEHANSVGATFLGQDIVVRHCTFTDNGQLGFAANRAHQLLMADCVVSKNNAKGFSRDWEAGGDKLVLCRGVTIERCIFRENHGTGIWFDIGNEAADVHNCLIADNEDAGIFYEISSGLHAHDNVIIGNGLAGTPGAWGVSSGISLSSSPGCTIERNLLIGNKEGLSFREAVRVAPRIDAVRGAAPERIWNHDEIVTHNVLAYNRDAQVWGWFDVDDERHWPAAMQEHKAVTDTHRLSLESLRLHLSANHYAICPAQELFHWGAPWKQNKAYNSLEEVQRELGLESGSRASDVNFRNYAERDFRLPGVSDHGVLACYPQGDVPDVRLGLPEQ